MRNFRVLLVTFSSMFLVVYGIVEESVPPQSSSIAFNIHVTPKETSNLAHPLDPLSPPEIITASKIIRKHFKDATQLIFCTLTLKEPKKAELLPYFLKDDKPPENLIMNRKAFVNVINPLTKENYEIVVVLLRNKVESKIKLSKSIKSPIAIEEDMDSYVLQDERVKLRLNNLGIKNISSGRMSIWDFGYLEDRPEYFERRICQVFLYFSISPDDNYFAHPIGFIVIFDVLQKIVLGIENLPIHSDFDVNNRDGDNVPLTLHNFDPTLLPSEFFRKGVTPIEFTQKDGTSFKLTGRQLEWQNFKLRIGFNEREGLVLHNINYDDNGTVRPLIYRASISELFVPYGDPRPPFHRKMAFDSGYFGLGHGSHEQHAPADCKGSVQFLDAVTSNSQGLPLIAKNAICIYEEDVGVVQALKAIPPKPKGSNS